MTTATSCVEIIEDIEDLISSQDITPKERYSSRKRVTVRSREKQLLQQQQQQQRDASEFVEIGSPRSVVPGSQTIYVKTWGCAHNNSDGEYMAGQLAAYGYKLTEEKFQADLWLLNSCTVKAPAEDHFRNEIERGRKMGKFVVVAGCVPQGAPKSGYLRGLSTVGVGQIDRVVETVERTLEGNVVTFLGRKKSSGGASLSLPKIRRNPLVEIIPINTGCLNRCTYCKTKHARGHLGSYSPEEIVERARRAFDEGVCELWLTSEDTGAYGRDVGTNLPELLWKVVDVVPEGRMMRVGMTNPPYILRHLKEMSEILKHPRVYSFLHVPVQSGSDRVLADMKREYNREDFERVVDFLRQRVPGVTIATDVICGFPTETDDDFEDTLDLCKKYKFPSLFINQFFSRPGTPAARMTKVPTQDVKKRTKRLSEFFQSYEPYGHKIAEIQKILVTEVSHDNRHYVGHNKFYEQVLIPMRPELMGKMVTVRIVEATKYSMRGSPIDDDDDDGGGGGGAYSSRIPQIHPYKYKAFAILVVFLAILARIVWKFFIPSYPLVL